MDLAIYEIVDILNPIAKELGATPNVLTTISGIFGLLAAYAVWKGQFIAAAIWFLLGYLFDCMDGNFARRYDMVTTFGDWYDHVKDITVFVLLLVAIWFQRATSISSTARFFVIFCIVLSYAGCMIVFGCQEKHYDKEHESATLAPLKCLCGEDAAEHLSVIKWFGCGTASLVIALLLICMR